MRPPGLPDDPPNRASEQSAAFSRITRIEVPADTRAPTGTTNAYLVDGVLIDPAAETAALDAAIATTEADRTEADADTDAGIDTSTDSDGDDGRVDAIAVTHTHPDHVGAVAAYADRMNAAVYAHADHVDRFRSATGLDPDETFRDGAALTDTGAVRVIETPGHTPDSVSFVVNEGSGLGAEGAGPVAIVGDLAVAAGSVVVGVPDGDLRSYLASLRQVRAAGFERLYPGHGRVVDDPEATCRRLIDHRLSRERRVLSAVQHGAADVDAVLDAAYEKDLAGVEDLARATVRAHLEKLAADERIPSAWADRS
ncbi:MAG: MBL fold metallo-hydrolase [Halorubrum sp.]